MPQLKNPFTPSFGSIPKYMAGRESILNDMNQAFLDGIGNPNLATILIGPRGTGKTALLSRIASIAQGQHWVTVDTVAADGMLEDIFQQTNKNAASLIDQSEERHLVGVGVGQFFSLEWERETPEKETWRIRMEGLLEQLANKCSGVLITVDEVRVEVEEMVQLVSTYQLLIREGFNVALVMAGLPMEVTDLIGDRRVTFLRRARQRYLGLIEDREIRQAFIKTIDNAQKNIETDALDYAVKATNGFPYMMQLIGYFMWLESGECKDITTAHAKRGVELAREDFRHGVLDATYNEMSLGDRAFAKAMLPDAQGSRLSDIARRMNKTNGYAFTYKRRLLKQGIIGERPGGLFDFDIPFMREYLAETDG